MRTNAARQTDAPRRVAVNVSLDPEVLARARARKLNLSRILEERLRELEAAEGRDWFYEENKEAVDAHNRRVDEHGCFGDEFRTF